MDAYPKLVMTDLDPSPGTPVPDQGPPGTLQADTHPDPLLAARGTRYGPFRVNAGVSQDIKAIMRAAPSWGRCDPDMREALEMIAHKISRIVSGDPSYDDSWVDIAGYATRVADRLHEQPKSVG